MILLNKIFTIKTNTEKLNNYKNTPDIEKLLNSRKIKYLKNNLKEIQFLKKLNIKLI